MEEFVSSWQHQKAARKRQETFYRAIDATPASDLQEFLRRRRQQAASRIHAWWKGQVARKEWPELKRRLQEERAARVLQKNFRAFLQRKSEWPKREETSSRFSPHLQNVIDSWQENSTVPKMTFEEQVSLYEEGQQRLWNFTRDLKTRHRRDDHLTARAALLSLTCETIQKLPPSTDDWTVEEANYFSIRSLPLAQIARSNHQTTMDKLMSKHRIHFEDSSDSESEY